MLQNMKKGSFLVKDTPFQPSVLFYFNSAYSGGLGKIQSTALPLKEADG